MDVLVVGAGVLGSLYAARLAESGNSVRVVARGERAAEIRERGVVLIDEASGRTTTTHVDVVEAMEPETTADVALVLVRRNHLEELLPALAPTRVPSIVFMTNNAGGPGFLIDALGRNRVLLGFPGAGGRRDGWRVRYRRVSRMMQPTTIGELRGRTTPRLLTIASVLNAAGFPVTLERNMDAWLKTHASMVSPIAHAIYAAAGSTHRLSRRPALLRLMLAAVRENLAVLSAIGIQITPARYGWMLASPDSILVPLLAAGLRTDRAELLLARHANAARDEMAAIYADLDSLRVAAGVRSPSAVSLSRTLVAS